MTAKLVEVPHDNDIEVVFYGDLFREKASKGGEPPYVLADLDSGIETDLIKAWLREAETGENDITEGDAHKGRVGSGWMFEPVQDLAVRLLRYHFFAGVLERSFVGDLKQVSRYLTDPTLRQIARQRLAARINSSTLVVIAHSLGSVIAYEALAQRHSNTSHVFITLGSPLGLPNVIFDRLEPQPAKGRGAWADNVRSWTNIADRHDLVAAVKDLAPLFGPKVRDLRVANETQAHNVAPYLTAPETGAAILEVLRG